MAHGLHKPHKQSNCLNPGYANTGYANTGSTCANDSACHVQMQTMAMPTGVEVLKLRKKDLNLYITTQT